MITVKTLVGSIGCDFSIDNGEYKSLGAHKLHPALDETVLSFSSAKNGAHIITNSGAHIHVLPF
jgi:hypothetical protein